MYEKITKDFYFNIMLLILVGILTGCANDANEESTTNSVENSSNIESIEKETTEIDESASTIEIEESSTDDTNDISSVETDSNDSGSISSENSESNVSDKADKKTLSQYSSEKIEYARVWLEVVNNKGIDTLKVIHISEGESVGQYEDKSVKYPENVVHLFTDFLAGGNVFYSSNGDGSIYLYDFPTRWPSPEQVIEERNQTMEEYIQSIIDNPKKVMIKPGDDEEVEHIIKKIEILD